MRMNRPKTDGCPRCAVAAGSAPFFGRASSSSHPKRDSENCDNGDAKNTERNEVSLLLFLGSTLGASEPSQGKAAHGFYNFANHVRCVNSSADRLSSDTIGSGAPGRCLWQLDRRLDFRRVYHAEKRPPLRRDIVNHHMRLRKKADKAISDA